MNPDSSYIRTWRVVLQRLGLTQVNFDEDGCLTALLERRYQLQFQLCPRHLLVHARIGEIVEADQDTVFKKCLNIMASHAKDRAEVIYLHDDKKTIRLATWLPHDLDADQADKAFEEYFDALYAWRDCIRLISPASLPKPAT